MENASKALIIAGAILIAIVLVTVSVVVVNSFDSDEAVSQMDQQEISSFNAKFESASGTKVRGSVVKTLLSNVITSNASNEPSKAISVNVDSKGETSDANIISQYSRDLDTSHTYTVLISYDTTINKGLVKTITITDNN